MLELMPVLSYHFSLSPSDVWGLTMDEFESYARALKEIEKANKDG